MNRYKTLLIVVGALWTLSLSLDTALDAITRLAL